MDDKQSEIRERYLGVGVAWGSALGVAIGAGFGVALGNLAWGIGLGVCLGAGLGIAVGSSLGDKHAKAVQQPSDTDGSRNAWQANGVRALRAPDSQNLSAFARGSFAALDLKETAGNLCEKLWYWRQLILMMILAILTAFSGARYVASPSSVLQIGTLLNVFVRPLLALAALLVMAIRFKDIWVGITDVNERMSYRITRFAQSLGLVMMGGALLVLVAVVSLHFAIPARSRAEVPLFFLFTPLIALMPIGYFMFELARAIEHDRQRAEI
jgi:hypothetical protein